MNFSSIMRQLANVINTLSFELALKKNDKEKHLSNAIVALNSCVDHLMAYKANNNQGASKKPPERRENHVKEERD